ncbi:Hypothetical predicted protein [Mytilus galloprovincialis]|uniref:Reverse transcriptase domain-containing protein n=1 Tax=Mytilus galloprovincialis TaxID=29158 RepID=A0A8B6GEG4_MYTGA|nr:Hypothetical predicted protein [Mytilus galloprovincialis]
MNLVLRGLTWKTVLAFLDDILVLGPSFDEHLTNLQNVFARFREYGLRLKPKKCALFRTSVEFLGRSVSNQGLQIGQQHLQPVSGWVVPTCTKEVEQFLGFVNYHRSFIKDYAKISAPLYEVTGKNLFSWNHERQLAFQTLKDNLLSAPVLTLPNNKDYFILDTDASQNAIGAELIQVQDGEERTIAYGSFVLTAEQKRYCTTRKELLAVIRFTRQFRHYLLGRQFTVRTDHSSLTWLVNFKEPQGQLARWLEELSQYDLVIKHRPGKQHIDADVLSRLPDRLKECPHYTADTILASLPCKGCNYCQRAHQSWAQFLCDVDEAVPLARKRKQKPRLLKRVATAMMMLFETPEKVSTLEQPAVTVESAVTDDCCYTSSLNSIEPIASQSSEECDLPPFSTGMELIFTPSTARIVMDDSSDCVVAAIAQEEGITISGFSEEDIKTGQESDLDLMFILPYLKDGCEPLSNDFVPGTTSSQESLD